jgi:DNA-binding SARP family transcriptional activator/Tfp pilus assembly protein PilF
MINAVNKPFAGAMERKVVPLALGRTAEARSPAGRPIARIHLLGVMRATSYLGDNILPRGKKTRALLGYLCLSTRERIPRARLAGMLWDRAGEAQARTSFRQALRELSAAMGTLAEELISTDRDTIRLNASVCWIDAGALLAKEPSNSMRTDLAVLCSGELLEELDGTSASFDQWLLAERTRFTEELRQLLESEIERMERPGCDLRQLAAVARRLIAFDPTHEGASRVLIRTLGKLGERAQALREYARCREALKTALDVEPSAETRALYEAMRMYAGSDNGARTTAAPARQPQEDAAARRALPGRNRLRVGVLPFLGGRSPKEENLAFSLSQEIAAALARFRWFDVIAPVSLMHQRTGYVSGFQLMPKDLDYIVDGSLSGSSKQFKINVSLLDLANHAQPVWSQSFKLAMGELHRLDELVTARIVGSIDPVILFIEGQPKRRTHYGATGLLLLAIPLMYSMERKKYEEAGAFINKALAIDPDNAMAIAWAAYWQMWYVGQGWASDLAGALEVAEKLCLRAIKIDPDNAEALGIYAHCCAWKREFEAALHFFDWSLKVNPNLAHVWALSAPTYCYIGKPDEALQRLARYRELAPFDPYFCFFENFFTIAYTFKGEYEQAALYGRRAVKANPSFVAGYKPLIAALGHLGRPEEAEPYIEKLLALEPGFSVREFGKMYPFKREGDRERYMEGLRLAGVPEQ